MYLTPALSRAAEDFSVAAIVDELGGRDFLSLLVVNKFRVHRRRFSSRHSYNTIHSTTRHSELLLTGRLALAADGRTEEGHAVPQVVGAAGPARAPWRPLALPAVSAPYRGQRVRLCLGSWAR